MTKLKLNQTLKKKAMGYKMTLSDKRKFFQWGFMKEGYYLEEDVKEFIKELKEEIDNAQEDYGNLDWISKKQALDIIDKRVGEKLK